MSASRLVVGLLIALAGCRSAPQAPLNPPPASPTIALTALSCGELASLPGRPLLAVTRLQCLEHAFVHGHFRGDGYRRQLRVLWRASVQFQPGQQMSPTAVEPPMEMLRHTEDFVQSINQAYWNLWAAYAVYLTRVAELELARDEEVTAEKLLSTGRITQIQREQARQERIAAEADVQQALVGGSDRAGLLDQESRLRQLIGYADCCPGLLLPCDGPQCEPPADCEVLMESARDHRLEMAAARMRIMAARGAALAAKESKRKPYYKAIQRAEEELLRRERQIALEIAAASERIGGTRKLIELAAERRRSVNEQLRDREKLHTQAAVDRAELLTSRRQLAAAIRDQFQATLAYRLAVVELERAAGLTLVRDGIRLPSAGRMEPPEPSLPAVPLPTCQPWQAPLVIRLDALASLAPDSPLPGLFTSPVTPPAP